MSYDFLFVHFWECLTTKSTDQNLQLTYPAEKLRAVNLVSGSASLSAPSRSLGFRRARQRAFAELMSQTCSSFWSVSVKAANFRFAEVCVCAAVMLIRTFLSLIKFIMPNQGL